MRYLSISQLSEVTGIDRRTVKKRLANVELHEVDGRAHRYDAHAVLPILYGEVSSENIDQRLVEEQLKYETARAEKIRIEVDKLRGQLVAVEEVARVVEKEYTAVRQGMLSIPTSLAMSLAIETDTKEIKRQLEDAINAVLAELSADERYKENEQNGRADTETSEESPDDSEAEAASDVGGMG
jgi:hypothetical protein